MNYFLLVYDRAAGKLLEEQQFSQRVEALQARFATEKLHRAESENVEVVVVSAASRDDLLRTHARYFLTVEELVRKTATAVEEITPATRSVRICGPARR